MRIRKNIKKQDCKNVIVYFKNIHVSAFSSNFRDNFFFNVICMYYILPGSRSKRRCTASRINMRNCVSRILNHNSNSVDANCRNHTQTSEVRIPFKYTLRHGFNLNTICIYMYFCKGKSEPLRRLTKWALVRYQDLFTLTKKKRKILTKYLPSYQTYSILFFISLYQMFSSKLFFLLSSNLF